MGHVIETELRRRAIEAAYRDHVDHVYRIAYAILRDEDAAADATQEAFARAFERWAQYDRQRPLRAWLHGIVAHVALDMVRRDRTHRRALPEIGWLRRGPAEGPPADRADSALVTLEEGLASLKAPARAALVLRHAYGYDYETIARMLGTSPGNVGSMLSRAHAQLRRRLIEAGWRPRAQRPPNAAGGE